MENNVNQGRASGDARRAPRAWAGAALWTFVAVANEVISGNRQEAEGFYNSLQQPAWAPPGWLFAPAWALNNGAQAWADVRLFDAPVAQRGWRWRAAVAVRGAYWVCWLSFGYVYFRRRSPVLGFATTALGTGLTLASAALVAKLDRRAAVLHTPTALWLLFASAVSGAVAWHNPDPLLGWRGAR